MLGDVMLGDVILSDVMLSSRNVFCHVGFHKLQKNNFYKILVKISKHFLPVVAINGKS